MTWIGSSEAEINYFQELIESLGGTSVLTKRSSGCHYLRCRDRHIGNLLLTRAHHLPQHTKYIALCDFVGVKPTLVVTTETELALDFDIAAQMDDAHYAKDETTICPLACKEQFNTKDALRKHLKQANFACQHRAITTALFACVRCKGLLVN